MTMNKTHLLALGATFSIVVKFALVPAPAVAQEAEREQAREQRGQERQEIEEIVVEAPTVVRRTVRRGRNVYELTELSRQVSYADLDLTRTADVSALEGRIDEAANQVCEELADMFPPLDRPERRCITDAVADAREQLQAAIDAATTDVASR
jgi:UrcA family protein